MTKVEICCGSVEDCIAAYLGGANRVELNSALHMGGLTPSIASLRLAKQYTDIPIVTMVRPRSAGFCYSDKDIETMFLDAKLLLENGADGIAFGFLHENGSIDIENTKAMIECIKSYGSDKEAVFHRAFDCVSDPYEAIEQCIDLKIDRILTSGLENKAIEGKDLIKTLVEEYGDEIEILAGSGVNDTNVKEFIEYTGVKQIHSSCKDWLIDRTTTMNNVSYAYHEKYDYEIVSEEKVKKLMVQCK